MLAVNDTALAVLPPCALLLGAVLQILAARLLSARSKGVLAVLSCLPAFLAVVALSGAVQSGRAVECVIAAWDGPFKLALHVDALSVLFAFMGTGLGTLVLLYSIGYMAHDRSATRFYATMLIFIGGFAGLVYSANLFVLYLCWEMIGLCSFTLVGFWYTQREAATGARKVLLMTHLAGYGLLAAILLLYSRAGAALWTDPAVSHAFTTGVFLLMLLALVAKSVQVPLHTWIPDAMAAPTPVSSLLHAACYVTAGVYLAARMRSLAVWPLEWNALLVALATVTMAVGVMYAMVQSDLKRMLAFSTISQIGYMMLGLAIGTPLAITAGLLHCLNHGFFKGGLFLNAGAVQHAAGSRDMNELGGLAQRMPQTTLCWLVGVGNMAGIPLMSGFVSKWMLYAAALQAGWVIPALVAWIVSLGTVFLCAKATSTVFLGNTTEKTREAEEAPSSMRWAMGLMAMGSLVLGVAPQIAVLYVLNPVLATLGMRTPMQVTWFGMFSGAGTFASTGGLILAIVSLLAGGGVYALTYMSRPRHVPAVATAGGAAILGGGIFTGGEPLAGSARLTARDFSRIFEENWSSFFRFTNVDDVYLSIWRAFRGASSATAKAIALLERHAPIALTTGSLVLLFAIRWFLPSGQNIVTAPESALPALITAACALSAAALIVAAIAYRQTRSAIEITLACLAALGGLMVEGAWLRLGLLETAALITVLLVWQSARTNASRLVYASAIVLSAAALVSVEALLHSGAAQWVRAFLITGVVIKFAAVPLFFWLLRMADELHPLVLGTIIGVVDIAAFGEIITLRQLAPDLFVPTALWIAIAVLTSLAASFLMLAERNLKRLLVLSTIEDVGFLLLGAAATSTLGLSGATAAAATHAMAKTLLFLCLCAPAADGALEGEHTALASRYPFSAFGFLFGMLAMLGVPPTLGFVGRWRLYMSALQMHGLLLAAFIAASAFALLAFMRALVGTWWGPASHSNGSRAHVIAVERRVMQPQAREPLVLRAAIVLLVLALLAGGVWPDAITRLAQGGRP